jgi:hypothetical protein
MNTDESVANPLRELSDFAASLSDDYLEGQLGKSSMNSSEKSLIRTKYGAMRRDLSRIRLGWVLYEKEVRNDIEVQLDRFMVLLEKGPEQREAIVRQFEAVLEKAGEINCFDKKLMDELAQIWPIVTLPEELPAFTSGRLPSPSEWPRYRLKEIFSKKQTECDEFWLEVYNDAFRLEIETATDAIKKKKDQLDAIVKSIDLGITLLTAVNKILGLAAVV